jgi:hypothetical protein
MPTIGILTAAPTERKPVAPLPMAVDWQMN